MQPAENYESRPAHLTLPIHSVPQLSRAIEIGSTAAVHSNDRISFTARAFDIKQLRARRANVAYANCLPLINRGELVKS